MGTPNPKENNFISTGENSEDVQKIANRNLNTLRNDPEAPYIFAFNGLLLELVMYQELNIPFDIEKALMYAKLGKKESTIYYLFGLDRLRQKFKPIESLGRDLIQKIVRDDPKVYNSMVRTSKSLKEYIEPLREEVYETVYAKVFTIDGVTDDFKFTLDDPIFEDLNIRENDIIKFYYNNRHFKGFYLVYKGTLRRITRDYGFGDDLLEFPINLREVPHIHYWDKIFEESLLFQVSDEELNTLKESSFERIGEITVNDDIESVFQTRITVNGKIFKVNILGYNMENIKTVKRDDSVWMLDRRNKMAPFVDKNTLFFRIDTE